MPFSCEVWQYIQDNDIQDGWHWDYVEHVVFVEFELEEDPKGSKAINVKLTEDQ